MGVDKPIGAQSNDFLAGLRLSVGIRHRRTFFVVDFCWFLEIYFSEEDRRRGI
jgi:hypothetical protein